MLKCTSCLFVYALAILLLVVGYRFSFVLPSGLSLRVEDFVCFVVVEFRLDPADRIPEICEENHRAHISCGTHGSRTEAVADAPEATSLARMVQMPDASFNAKGTTACPAPFSATTFVE